MTKIETKHIRTDGGTQARAGLNNEKVNEYKELLRDSGGEWPFKDPIVVFYDGTDYWLADGFHRFHACWTGGRYVVEADVRQGTRREAQLYAAGANAEHGLPRTAEDKKRAVTLLLEDAEWGKWSDREIARRCRVSPTFVGSIRKELGDTVHVDSERVYTRNGSEQVMDTAAIGGKPRPSTDDMRKRLRQSLRHEMYEPYCASGIHDSDLKYLLSRDWGLGGGSSGPEMTEVYKKGGSDPGFWYNSYRDSGKPTLRGKELIALVREVLELPYPQETAVSQPDRAAEFDEYTRRFNEKQDLARQTAADSNGRLPPRSCPRCGPGGLPELVDDNHWRCTNCGREYDSTGKIPAQTAAPSPFYVGPMAQGPEVREALDRYLDQWPVNRNFITMRLASVESSGHDKEMQDAVAALGASDSAIYHQAMVLRNDLPGPSWEREKQPGRAIETAVSTPTMTAIMADVDAYEEEAKQLFAAAPAPRRPDYTDPRLADLNTAIGIVTRLTADTSLTIDTVGPLARALGLMEDAKKALANRQAYAAWLRDYQDDDGRRWTDLSDNQTWHKNSPCYQAFTKAFPGEDFARSALMDAKQRLEQEAAVLREVSA